jgi:hypothetical protein
MATMTGDISLMPIGDVVIWIANRRQSCVLAVKRGPLESKFVIRAGQAWQAASADPREYLGQHLINFGYIEEDQLQKAFDTQQETHVPLGRVLVMVDAVTPEQLARVLLFKTRESLLETMVWTEGTFRVNSETPEDRELDTEHPIDLFDVHSEGTARAQMWREIRRVFPSDATRCDVSVDVATVESAFDRRLLALMQAGMSVGEASLELRSMDFQTYARLYDLYNRKLIRPRLLQSGVQQGQTTHQATRSHIATLPSMRPLEHSDDEDDVETDIGVEISDDQVVGRESVNAGPAPIGGREGEYMMVRPARPEEAPGVEVPADARDPQGSLRSALASRNWNEALILSQRILEVDPHNTEAIAAYRVAEIQVRRAPEDGQGAGQINRIPSLTMPREQIALAHLTSKERYVLSRIDGRRTLQQIAAVSPIQKAELVRIVEAFVNRGVVKLSS